MPSRFSTATAMTSTPRVIQVSTISFCLAGSGSVGPSQISSTPSSLGRLLGALAAGDEVGVALALGHHGDGDRPASAGAAGRRPGRRGGRSPARASSRSERTRYDVARRRRSAAAARMTAQSTATCEFFTSNSSSSRGGGVGEAAGARAGRRSRPIATSSSTPVRMPASSGGQVGQPQAVLQHGDGEQPEQRAEDRCRGRRRSTCRRARRR